MTVIVALEWERSLAQKQESLKHTINQKPTLSIIMKPSTVIKVQPNSMFLKGKQKTVNIYGDQTTCMIPLDNFKLKFCKCVRTETFVSNRK